MARIGVFGRRTEAQEPPAAVDSTSTDRTVIIDRDRDGVDDREERLVKPAETKDADTDNDGVVDDAEARAAHERTQARLAARERLAAQERVEGRAEGRADERATGRTAVVERPPVVDRDRDGVDDRVQDRPERKWRARASILATLALMVGLTSVYASLSGRLAPAGIALGVLGLLFAIGGLSATGRPKVAGGGMATFALLLSLAGAVFGILAVNHTTSWLDSDVDQIARWRDWIDTQFPFVKGW